jgi:predicted dehydrogenase
MGTGRWGRNLVRVLRDLPGASLEWLVDPDEKNLNAARTIAPSARAVAHIDRTNNDFDAVVIATPAGMHESHAAALLARQKHVLVEKPATLGAAAAHRLIALCRKQRLTLMTGHQLLYHPGFEAVLNAVEKGAIGAVTHIEAIRTTPLDLSREPGVIWSLAPHDIAMILRLTGSAPSRVSCDAVPKGRPFAATKADIDLAFPAGTTAVIRIESSETRVRLLTVTGTLGALRFDDAVRGGAVVRQSPHTSTAARLSYPAVEPLSAECAAFIAAIAENTPPLTGEVHILNVTDVLERCSIS